MSKYRFEHWEDPKDTDPRRVIDLKANKVITGYYKKVEVVGTVVMKGSVSAQAESGETVNITVTLPDGTTEIVTTTTLPDRTFSKDYTNKPGDYKAKARIEENALYKAAEGDVIPFTIGKEPRTITLTVTPK